MTDNSPYFRKPTSVRSVMLKVLAALLPGIAAYVWFFGNAILVQLALCSVAALAGEWLILTMRKKPAAVIWMFVSDGSALVTAWLIALSFPSVAPWWLPFAGTLFAIIIVKHLYGGLGQNPFNPAMAAYCLMIVAYPLLMSQWPALGMTDFVTQMQAVFGHREIDAMVMATPLDALRTALHAADTGNTVAGVFGASPVFGALGGRGWEWIAAGYLAGGLWLLQQRIISWHIPVAFLATLAAIATLASLLSPASFAGPAFHLFSGGAMLCAFFIATDPVSGATTPKGKLIFAAGIGLITWVIRTFGAYPDGIAFATLLMNLCVPLIDMHTQPAVFGHKGGDKP
jgi:electron transport complex protein RnfD